MQVVRVFLFVSLLATAMTGSVFADEAADPEEAADPTVQSPRIERAVRRALGLLERASAGTAEQRKCFTCHGQALPVLALGEAKQRGFAIDDPNFERQLDHTYQHLRRGRKAYLSGDGQGGGVDTAGYALWTLEYGGPEPDEVTESVIGYLLEKQRADGSWKCRSNRPPSEASDFTTSYLALRALDRFLPTAQRERLERVKTAYAKWLAETQPEETESMVFRALGLQALNGADESLGAALDELVAAQNADGGWSQREGMTSDAYATGTVLYALSLSEVSTARSARRAGIDFLLSTQQEDGSWHVVSRSKPFQKYFESSFPHGNDQFISTTATAWATLALLISDSP